MNKKRLKKGLFYGLLLLGAGLVLYLSWRPQPKMGLVWFVPGWLARWADEQANDRLRTAVPLVLLGLLVGVPLARPDRAWPQWLVAWAALVALVVVAEVGQLLLAQRSFDWYDIAWGAAGAGAGLLVVALVKGGYQVIRRPGHESGYC